MTPLQGVTPDSVRAVLDSVFAGPAYAWAVRQSPLAFLFRWFHALQTFLDGLRERHPAAFFALLFGLSCVLVVLLVHIGYVLKRALGSRAPEQPVAAVPGRPVRDEAWHLDAFRRLLSDGRYAEAMAERYAALVLRLGRRTLLRVDRSKTPAEYALEARVGEDDRRAMIALVSELYQRLFGRDPCTLDDVRRFAGVADRVGEADAAA